MCEPMCKGECESEKTVSRIFNFGQALIFLKLGEKVSRHGWNGDSQYLYLDKEVEGIEPVIIIRLADDKKVAWTPSQTDILSIDWYVIK